MKKLVLTLFVALLVGVQAMGDTYETLWKQAAGMQRKDLPKSELMVMGKIIAKATAEKNYGQLLAAEMRRTMLWGAISNDSIMPAIKRMERKALQTNDPMLKAVWYAALGKLYQTHPYDIEVDSVEVSDLSVVNRAKGKAYFKKALAQPELLARHKSSEYAPLTMEGLDGSSFKNDMLHLIGFEVNTKEAYQLMHDYYQKVENRGAACLCAFEITQIDRQEDVREVRKSKYLQTIDSLIHVYQDIPEAGELTVEHYRFMEGATDASALDKLNYINYALSRWGGWSRMNVLRNAKKRLTEPMFETERVPVVVRPNQRQWIVVKVRNLQSLKMTISRLDITADNDYDVRDKNTYKMLMTKTSPLHQKDQVKQFYGRPNYEIVKDSFEVAGLPIGAYMIEMVSDNASVEPDRYLFYVSDLALMAQQLPDDSHRYVVVSATTGQPIANAKLLLYDDIDNAKGKGKRTVHAKLTTDENGEVSYKNIDCNIFVSTNTDKYTPAKYIYLSRQRYYERKEDLWMTNIYTDRSIYRPGQTVHVSSVSFVNLNGLDAKVVDSKEEVKYTLRDANNKVVGEKTATMDEYGTASVDFELPQEGQTGRYEISTNKGGYGNIRVEEYKRPTFEITFPQVNQRYAWGDTVVVRGTAKTYVGIPVQGAKVSYQVTRRSQLWWWGSRSADQVVMNGNSTTREDGTFDVEIPLEPVGKDINDFMRKARFFNFDVEATVTDMSGESHIGEMSLPLATKPTAFSVDLKKRTEVDSLKQITFSYRNSGGMVIAGKVRYRIGEGEWMNATTNIPINIRKEYPMEWKSGVYQLEAICEQDTLLQKFTLFSMDDSHPIEQTTEWSYQTASQFPRDGKPVYVQVGSSENGVHIVYSIIAGNKLLEKGTWELGDSIITLPFTYRPEYASGMVLDYSFVKNGKCYSKTIRIARPLPEKQLNITWKTFRNRLTPGQKEEWTLNITTPDGKPAKAQLMSVLYDKSLDQLDNHTWDMSLGLYQMLPSCFWTNNLSHPTFGLSGIFPTKYYVEKDLDIDHFADSYFEWYMARRYKVFNSVGGKMLLADKVVEAVRSSAPTFKSSRVSKPEAVASVENSDKVSKKADNVQVRENLNETAFFYPAMETDAKGNVCLKFTLPESITTWKFMGLAHDKEMRNGILIDEAVAKKTVMVQPNMPRFLREGDKALIMTKVFNTSDKKVNGSIRMEIIEPETNKVVLQKTQKYEIDANGVVALSFDIVGLKEGVYINKVVAAGNGYSDGEQHYLPVLSNRELVTNTLPFTLHDKGVRNIELSSLFADKSKDAKNTHVTIEYTNHPSWLMIQALPTISNPSEDNAISLMSAIYSNGITRYIKHKYQQVDSLDKPTDAQRLANQVAKLRELQNADGSFSWWKGMDGSRYMTTAVAKMMVRLNKMTGMQVETADMLTHALGFLQEKVSEEVKNMKKEEKKAQAGNDNKWQGNILPSESALDYLYILSLDGRKLSASATADVDYLIKKMADKTGEFTIYGKAQAAIVLAKAGYRPQASDYLKSINEYTVYTEEMGRYFDTRKAYYSWRDYKIPTQVAAIEAIQLLSPEKKQEIEEMQRWLLQSKRTQAWDTPINTVNAVYVFMNGNEGVLAKATEKATIKLDGKTLAFPKTIGEQGYVKTTIDGVAKVLTVDKKNHDISWGAVYAQFTQPATEIASSASGIKITRKVERIGDKAKVTLEMKADRDYDFVQIVDKRAACLEPVNQKSGCQMGGYYISPRDNTTNYYFDRLSKGKHIVSTEYYIDRKGEYQAGTCSVQCAYSPEFGGHTESYSLNIKEE